MMRRLDADAQLENDTVASWKKQKSASCERDPSTSTSVSGSAVTHSSTSTTVRFLMNALLPSACCPPDKHTQTF